MNYYPPDLVKLFREGDGGGDPQVLERGIKLFSKFISDEMQDCIEVAQNNNVMIWDYFEDKDNSKFYSDEIQDLWVTFLIQEADKKEEE